MILHNQSKKAFTLVELLVVISIISLLTSIVLASLNDARAKARDVRRLTDMKAIQTALELRFSDTNSYPSAPSGGGYKSNHSGCPWQNVACDDNGFRTALVPKYIAGLPLDPINDAGHYYRYERIVCGGTVTYIVAVKKFEANPNIFNPNTCNFGTNYVYDWASGGSE